MNLEGIIMLVLMVGIIIGLITVFVMALRRGYEAVTAKPVQPTAPPSLGAGLCRAAGIFLLIGLVVGVGCFLLAPAVGAFAASGIFTLAIVLWIIGKCVP